MEEIKDLEQKQQYLRDEILDKSYDIDEFSEFMSKYKENGTDLKNWEFSELKEVVKNFKNRAKEDESQKIERGVENIRQSFRFDNTENDKENSEENLDIDLKTINNNENNNCVNNILNDYLKNKENNNNKINKEIKEENKEKINSNNNNLYPDLDNSIINNNNTDKNDMNKINNKNEIKFEKNNTNNSSILIAELDISKKQSEKYNIQTISNNSNSNENALSKNNNVIITVQNKKIEENNNNNQIGQQNIINNNINITNENFAKNLRSLNNNIPIANKEREFDDFEILDKGNVNKVIQEKINCVRQPENSLTKKDNLYVNIER